MGETGHVHRYSGTPGENPASNTPRATRETIRPEKLKAVAWRRMSTQWKVHFDH